MATIISSLKDGGQVFIHTLGRQVRVTAVATSTEDANAYLTLHKGQGVIAEAGGVVFMADVEDLGTKAGKVDVNAIAILVTETTDAAIEVLLATRDRLLEDDRLSVVKGREQATTALNRAIGHLREGR